jgi:5-methylcytosine-specific restriction enzyme A
MDRSPFQLSSPFPVTCNGGKGPLEKLLREGCSCCDSIFGNTATLTKRKQSNGVFVVALQCDNCGSAKSNGLKKAHFPGFDSFPLFDEERQKTCYQLWSARREEEFAKEREIKQREWEDEYRIFLKSPEWDALRKQVLERDGFCCQACGQIKTQYYLQVHHLTYRLGFQPPLWLLKTVCLECHDRLHADKHSFADPWCPPSIPLTSQ